MFLADEDGRGVLCAGPQGLGVRVVGERDAGGPPAIREFRGSCGRCAALPTWVLWLVLGGQQDGEGRQSWQDLVFADVEVLRPSRVGTAALV